MPAGFAALLAAAARQRPGQPALVWDGGALSWRDLEQRAGGIARRLAESGVQPGDVVALMLPNTWSFVAWSAWSIGSASRGRNVMREIPTAQSATALRLCEPVNQAAGRLATCAPSGSAPRKPIIAALAPR